MDVTNNFVGEKANRKQLFCKFSKNDVPIKVSFLSKSTQTVALWTYIHTYIHIIFVEAGRFEATQRLVVSIYLIWIFVCLLYFDGRRALTRPICSAPSYFSLATGLILSIFTPQKRSFEVNVREKSRIRLYRRVSRNWSNHSEDWGTDTHRCH